MHKQQDRAMRAELGGAIVVTWICFASIAVVVSTLCLYVPGIPTFQQAVGPWKPITGFGMHERLRSMHERMHEGLRSMHEQI